MIANELGCSERTVWKWRTRFEANGLAALRDAPRAGRPLVHGPTVRARLIALACTRPPETAEGLRRTRWTHQELAVQVGMSESQAHEILRAAEIKPHLLEQWVMSELGPDFDARAAEVCGLYLDPPEGALVVSIDEKTGIQAKAPTRDDVPVRARRRSGASTSTSATAQHRSSPHATGAPRRRRSPDTAEHVPCRTSRSSHALHLRLPSRPVHSSSLPAVPEPLHQGGPVATTDDLSPTGSGHPRSRRNPVRLDLSLRRVAVIGRCGVVRECERAVGR